MPIRCLLRCQLLQAEQRLKDYALEFFSDRQLVDGDILLRPAGAQIAGDAVGMQYAGATRWRNTLFAMRHAGAIRKPQVLSNAGSLAGKLGFATTSMFGRVGRALLRALYRRQHEKRWNWNVQLEYTFRWWVEAIYTALPREVPLRLTDAPRAVSYSDGEGADAGVGVALWLPGYPVPMAAFMETPRELRMLWARQLQQSAALGHDIFEIEAIGPLIVLSMWGHLMHGMLWTHYIDNTGAQAALVKGSSSVDSATILAAHFWSAVAAASIHAWLDRVASESNPVDALSRKDNRGPWRRVELAWLLDKLLAELRAYLFG